MNFGKSIFTLSRSCVGLHVKKIVNAVLLFGSLERLGMKNGLLI